MERYRGLLAAADPTLTRVAAVAARLGGTSMATVSVVDGDRAWFLGTYGLGAEQSIAVRDGLCANVLRNAVPAASADALADPRTGSLRFVLRHDVRFYACVAVLAADGRPLGAVTVMDTETRPVDDATLGLLAELAGVVREHLDMRADALAALSSERRLRDAVDSALLDAQRDRDDAQTARDDARRDRDNARSDRREAEMGRQDARSDRDSAMRDRDSAEHDRDVIEEYASVLQRTLLPPMLPHIDGLTLAAHYHPASPRQVGGDFYDAFALDDHRWAFTIGDVEGHGVEAAVTTSLIRYTLRAAALHHRDLTDAVGELNGVLLRELDSRRFATVLLGTVEGRGDAPGFRVTLATGGHLPALLVDAAAGSVTPVLPQSGMFVGAIRDARFASCDVELAPGRTLLVYTDGLIEARRGVRPFDEDALAAFVAERTHLDATGLVEDIATLVPKLEPDDDVAVLAITAR